MSAGFTPGPWSLHDRFPGVVITAEERPSQIAAVSMNTAWDEGTFEANACLIAAAPELYDMVQQLVDYDGRKNRTHINEIARALLAKARGESPHNQSNPKVGA